MKRTKYFAVAAAGLCLMSAAAACGSAGSPSSDANAASTSTIKIGYLGDLTGVAASSFTGGLAAAQARIDLANAQGGVNGHKLELFSADTGSTTAQTLTAAEKLVQDDNVFGVITDSGFVFAASKYLQQQGIPVTGWGVDGPEWTEQPNTNMFDADEPILGPLGGTIYQPTYDAVLMKQLGVKKLATLAFSGSPASVQEVTGVLAAAEQSGISACYHNYGVPFGGTDFTAIALQIKNSGCDAVRPSFVESSDIALAEALKNAGVKLKVMLLGIYSQDILDSASARAAVQGAYTADNPIDITASNSGTRAFLGSLQKYDPGYKAEDIPSYGQWTSWAGADLMVYGLQLAGHNPTRQSFMSALRKVNSWDSNGLLATAVRFTHFGTVGMLPATPCLYYLRLDGDKFVSVNGGQKVCGKYIPTK